MVSLGAPRAGTQLTICYRSEFSELKLDRGRHPAWFRCACFRQESATLPGQPMVLRARVQSSFRRGTDGQSRQSRLLPSVRFEVALTESGAKTLQSALG